MNTVEIAILLPDGSVLIAGGQYRPDGSGQNHPGLSDLNGQIYYPGYMQAAARPTITGTFPLAMPYRPSTPTRRTASRKYRSFASRQRRAMRT